MVFLQQPNSDYWWHVAANVTGRGSSAYSTPILVRINLNAPVVSYTPADRQALLTWGPVANADDYAVETAPQINGAPGSWSSYASGGHQTQTSLVVNNPNISYWRVTACMITGYGPVSNAVTVIPGRRRPVDTAVGPDGNARILWSGSDNSAQLWTVNSSSGSSGVLDNNFYYAPVSTDWTLSALAMGATDNSARVLWRNSNYTISIWTVNLQGGISDNKFLGSYPGFYSATALAVEPNNFLHVLWPSSNNGGRLQALTPQGQIACDYSYGPYSGWTATGLSVGPDTIRRVLWDYTSGQVNLWNVNSQGVVLSGSVYGPYADWTALRVVTAPDNTSRVLWRSNAGAYAIWKVDANNNYVSQGNYGPYDGWSIVSLACNPDGTLRVLWDDGSGMTTLWKVDNSWNVTVGVAFGPFSGATSLAAPTGLIQTAGSGNVSLAWTTSAGATGYAIYRSVQSGGRGFVRIASVPPPNTSYVSYTDPTAMAGTPYYYTVAAINAQAESSLSNQVTATPY